MSSNAIDPVMANHLVCRVCGLDEYVLDIYKVSLEHLEDCKERNSIA